VFLDAKSKVASIWEIVFPQFVLSDLIETEKQGLNYACRKTT
jgi:hypothetical protein